jgi:pSer/pThr/pTyr-binding forkhead associated (FHA) protein
MTLPTKQIELVTSEINSKATWGTARFSDDGVIMVHIRDANEPIQIVPKTRIVIGRSDTSTPNKPDLDLTPFGALERGVSRNHAAIYRSEDTLTLVDLGSANGTHLNGQRLIPEQPRVLRDGDEIRFGKLVIHIYFKTLAAL